MNGVTNTMGEMRKQNQEVTANSRTIEQRIKLPRMPLFAAYKVAALIEGLTRSLGFCCDWDGTTLCVAFLCLAVGALSLWTLRRSAGSVTD